VSDRITATLLGTVEPSTISFLQTAVPVVDVVVPSSSPRPTFPLMHAMVTHGTPRALLVCASDLLHHLHSCMKDVGGHWDHRHDEHVSLCIFFITRCMSAVAYMNVLRLCSLPAVAHGSLKTASPDLSSLFLIAAPLLPPPDPRDVRPNGTCTCTIPLCGVP